MLFTLNNFKLNFTLYKERKYAMIMRLNKIIKQISRLRQLINFLVNNCLNYIFFVTKISINQVYSKRYKLIECASTRIHSHIQIAIHSKIHPIIVKNGYSAEYLINFKLVKFSFELLLHQFFLLHIVVAYVTPLSLSNPIIHISQLA